MQEFNNQLVEDNESLTIIEYIKLANEKIHHIEIDFIDDFMNLVNKDECCIHHNVVEIRRVNKPRNFRNCKKSSRSK